jgi:hypothetical protein
MRAIALVLVVPLVDATSIPGRVPQSSNTVFWTDAAISAFSDGDDGTDEIESSSDDDWSSWLVGGAGPSRDEASSTTKSIPEANESVTTKDSAANVLVEKELHNEVTDDDDERPADIEQEAEYQSRPLQTLEKLQQMLDDTDYMTAAKSKHKSTPTKPLVTANKPVAEAVIRKRHTLEGDADAVVTERPRINDSTSESKPPTDSERAPLQQQQQQGAELSQSPASSEQLWQSKDRGRYKRQQLKLRRSLEAQIESPAVPTSPEARCPPVIRTFRHPQCLASSDDEQSDDTDDGLGYSLPNLPVYYSDAESEEHEAETASTSGMHPQQQPPPGYVDPTIRTNPQIPPRFPLPLSPPVNNYYYPYPTPFQTAGMQPPPQHRQHAYSVDPSIAQQHQSTAPHAQHSISPDVHTVQLQPQSQQQVVPPDIFAQQQKPSPHGAQAQSPPQPLFYPPHSYPPNYPYPYPPYGQYAQPPVQQQPIPGSYYGPWPAYSQRPALPTPHVTSLRNPVATLPASKMIRQIEGDMVAQPVTAKSIADALTTHRQILQPRALQPSYPPHSLAGVPPGVYSMENVSAMAPDSVIRYAALHD